MLSLGPKGMIFNTSSNVTRKTSEDQKATFEPSCFNNIKIIYLTKSKCCLIGYV